MNAEDDERKRTLWCGNLSEKVTEDLLYELFLQAGPLENVKIPKDRSGKPLSYAFITFKHSVSVLYAKALMEGISLFKKPLRLQYRSGNNSEENPYLIMLEKHQRRHSKSPPLQNREQFHQNGTCRSGSYNNKTSEHHHPYNGYKKSSPVWKGDNPEMQRYNHHHHHHHHKNNDFSPPNGFIHNNNNHNFLQMQHSAVVQFPPQFMPSPPIAVNMCQQFPTKIPYNPLHSPPLFRY